MAKNSESKTKYRGVYGKLIQWGLSVDFLLLVFHQFSYSISTFHLSKQGWLPLKHLQPEAPLNTDMIFHANHYWS